MLGGVIGQTTFEETYELYEMLLANFNRKVQGKDELELISLALTIRWLCILLN